MTQPPKPWEIAARLEDAAKAVTAASRALDAACSSILATGDHISNAPAWVEWQSIPGLQYVSTDMAKALQALSDKYQAVADAVVEA